MTNWEIKIQDELKKIIWQSGIRSIVLEIIQREIKKAIEEITCYYIGENGIKSSSSNKYAILLKRGIK